MPVPKSLVNIDPDNPPPTNVRIEVAECMSFDSRHNVLIPKKVRQLEKYNVESVRCGAAHSIVFCGVGGREADSKSSGSADLDDEDSVDSGVSGGRFVGSTSSSFVPSESKSFMKSPYSVDSKSGTEETAQAGLPSQTLPSALSYLSTIDIADTGCMCGVRRVRIGGA